MKPLEQLKALLNKKYESEDGDEFTVELLHGLSDSEIEAFKKTLPSQHLPADIEELLRFSKGFEFSYFDTIQFTSYGEFGFEKLFPQSIQLAGDGLGNFWVLDIDNTGHWGPVYYVCHDPAVVVKNSENLSEFLQQLDQYASGENPSNLISIDEQLVFDIWEDPNGIMEQYKKTPDFSEEFMKQLPELMMIADMTSAKNKTGFAWGKYGANNKILRYDDKPIWVLEKKRKRGFLERLFGGS
ncbi:MAG: hypothetical protein K0R51_3219 [Cytophagaceae bacterium]|jgi:hypothetical protein|nr:hypothetical protein [Cytophagaceae bacterium]